MTKTVINEDIFRNSFRSTALCTSDPPYTDDSTLGSARAVQQEPPNQERRMPPPGNAFRHDRDL